jgi:hypothetical protein
MNKPLIAIAGCAALTITGLVLATVGSPLGTVLTVAGISLWPIFPIGVFCLVWVRIQERASGPGSQWRAYREEQAAPARDDRMAIRRRRLVASFALSLAVTAGIAGCERALVVPTGAQTVHATVTREAVRLEPTTLRAGMTYLTVDSDGTELMFIGGAAIGGGETEPSELIGLTDEHLDAVLHGDLVDTYISSGFRSGGELGNASELGELPAGKYLFLPDGIVILEPGAYDSIPPNVVAVLEVVP